MDNNKQIGFTAFKILISLCFPIFYLFVNLFSRYGFDDISNLTIAENGEIFKTINYSYMFHEGGYLGLLTAYFSYAIFSVYTYFVFLIIALYSSLIYLIKSISKVYNTPISNVDTLFYTSLIMSALYIMTTGRAEIWHSQTCMVYQQTAIFLVLSISFLLRKKNVLACIALVLLMNSRIFWSLFSFAFYLLFLFVQYRKTKKIDRELLIILFFMTMSLLIYIVAPGNYVRKEGFSKLTSVFEGERNFLFSIQKIGSDFFNMQNLIAAIFLTPIVLMIDKKLVGKIMLPKLWLPVPFLLFLAIGISTSILLYLSTGMYHFQNRVWYFNNLLFVFVCLYYLLVFYHFVFAQRQIKPIVLKVFVLAIATYSVVYYYKTAAVNYPVIKEYAKEYDNRIEIIKNCKLTNKEILEVDALPSSGILMSWGLAEGDETYTRMFNEALCKYHHKDITLIVRKKSLQ